MSLDEDFDSNPHLIPKFLQEISTREASFLRPYLKLFRSDGRNHTIKEDPVKSCQLFPPAEAIELVIDNSIVYLESWLTCHRFKLSAGPPDVFSRIWEEAKRQESAANTK